VFFAGTVVGGTAASMDQIAAGRLLQGFGGGFLLSVPLVLWTAYLPRHLERYGFAVNAAVWAISAVIGPPTGALLVALVDWRAVFWVNIPVAIIALVLTASAKPENTKHPAPLDYRGAALVSGGMGLAVLGLQQSSVWGWGSATTWTCIAVGVALLAAFVAGRGCMTLADFCRSKRIGNGRRKGPARADRCKNLHHQRDHEDREISFKAPHRLF